MAEIQLTYDFNAVPTVRAFTKDKHFIKAITGPFGSGKSSGCVLDLFSVACNQQPDEHGVRKTRFAVVRNSYGQLKDTTKKTIDEWLPFAKWKEYEHTFYIDVKLGDGTIVKSEWLLRALDRPEHVSNLLSLEITAAWLNEARELPKEIFEAVQGRVGRYPKKRPEENYLVTWSGLILDTNPPDTDSWFYNYFEVLKPKWCKTCKDKKDNPIIFTARTKSDNKIPHCPKCMSEDGDDVSSIYHQPSGLSDEAENIKYLPDNYYGKMAIGKDDEFIKVYIHGEYGYVRTGKPVFPNYKEITHKAESDLKPIVGLPILIGMDFGRTPACVIGQMDAKGRVLVLDELTSEYMDIREFSESLLKPLLNARYRGYEHLIIGDPSGIAKSSVDSTTVFGELKKQGLKARPARTNNLQARLSAVNSFLIRQIEGKPAFLISPHCVLLRKALNGDYAYRRKMISLERYTDEPDKNDSSHIADSLQYMCLEFDMGFNGFNSSLSLLEKYDNVHVEIPTAAWT